MYDLIVIGGGPAALGAAFFAAGKHLHAVMIYRDLGGKVGWLDTMPDFGLPPTVPSNELAYVLTARTMAQAGFKLDDRVLSIETCGAAFRVNTERNGVLHGRAALLATGATPLTLQVPGAERFLEQGLGFVAHAQYVAGERVAVIGGGARALVGAAELALSAALVYVIARRLDQSDPHLLRALQQRSNVELLEGYTLRELRGRLALASLIVEGPSGARELPAERAFAALGLEPDGLITQPAATDAAGFVIVNARHETATPGLYAAGDVTSIGSEQALTALGDGTRAAMRAYEYILVQRLAN